MAFSIDHSKAFDVIPEGEYEFIISACRLNATRGGTEYIDVQLTVRNDVAQKQQGRVVYHAIWRAKQPNAADQACDGFMASNINQLSRAADLTNGKSYNGIADWCADLVGKPLRATVYHDEYNGNVNARVNRLNKTNYPDVQHRGAQTQAAQVTVSDKCPF